MTDQSDQDVSMELHPECWWDDEDPENIPAPVEVKREEEDDEPTEVPF